MPLIESIYVLMFFSGILGGFGHCIGMCGPVVATYSLRSRQATVIPHLLYNAGRVTTYSLLGGLMGLTGSFTAVVRSIEGLQHITMVLIGVMMIILGLGIAGWLPGLRKIEAWMWTSQFIANLLRGLAEIRSTGIYYPIGMVMGFIPCGLSYTVLIAAAGTGAHAGNPVEGFLQGMLMLFLFGIGTFPALFIFGQVLSSRWVVIRRWLYKGSAFLMMLAGMLFLYRAIR